MFNWGWQRGSGVRGGEMGNDGERNDGVGYYYGTTQPTHTRSDPVVIIFRVGHVPSPTNQPSVALGLMDVRMCGN